MFSVAPELPSLIPMVCCSAMSGATDTRVIKDFGIISESTMLNNLQSIATENCCQLLNSPEINPVLYVSNHPAMERLFMRYRINISYPKTRLMYSTPTRRIQLRIALPSHAVQAHLRSTILSSLMVSDLSLHAYSIHKSV